MGPFLYKAIKKSLYKGELSYSQRLSVILLIHKKGDKDILKNYRPISLTNTDYKIIKFVLEKRLQNILFKLINKNQTAYIKGRYIWENARLILDIFEYCETENINGLLLYLDFEKAFDSVEWNFLFKALQKVNISNKFIKWANILYTKPIFKMKNNGWLSKTCPKTRGVRQGCPLSALLYLFVAGILSIKINSNQEMKGKTINNCEIKSIQHAGDLSLALKNETSMEHALNILNEFCENAGSTNK